MRAALKVAGEAQDQTEQSPMLVRRWRAQYSSSESLVSEQKASHPDPPAFQSCYFPAQEGAKSVIINFFPRLWKKILRIQHPKEYASIEKMQTIERDDIF